MCAVGDSMGFKLDEGTTISFPKIAIQKLVNYMMWKDRTPDVFAALVASCKVLTNDCKEIKNMGPSTCMQFNLYAPRIAFAYTAAIEAYELAKINDMKPLHTLITQARKGEITTRNFDSMMNSVKYAILDRVADNTLLKVIADTNRFKCEITP